MDVEFIYRRLDCEGTSPLIDILTPTFLFLKMISKLMMIMDLDTKDFRRRIRKGYKMEIQKNGIQ